MKAQKQKKVLVSEESLSALLSAVHLVERDAEPAAEYENPAMVQEERAILEQLHRLQYEVNRLRSIKAGSGDLQRYVYDPEKFAGATTFAKIAAMQRGLIMEINGIVASMLPARKGRSTGRRRVRQMEPGVGDKIRADATRMPKQQVYEKWCFNKDDHPKLGVPGGKGKYSMQQVRSAIAWNGGQLRGKRAE